VEADQAMQMRLNAMEWNELERAQHQERGVRNWKRYQAIRPLAARQTPLEVAAALGCRKSSVYNWIEGVEATRAGRAAVGAPWRRRTPLAAKRARPLEVSALRIMRGPGTLRRGTGWVHSHLSDTSGSTQPLRRRAAR
jgi:hypothetical protein